MRKRTTRNRVRAKAPIVVRVAPGRPKEARVQLAHGHRRAAIGRGGARALKLEGDGGTPLGRLPIARVLYRADRIVRPRTSLPTQPIREGDGWCDDPADPNYNRQIRRPPQRGGKETPSAESLMRKDALYDLVLVLGYNDRPRIKNRGSAIFAHLARPGYTPTDGCIALSRRDLLAVLAEASPTTALVVTR